MVCILPDVTLGDALRGRGNALHFARLVLACGVVVSHSWPLGGFGPNPEVAGETLGHVCVAGFFAISGYLIPISRQGLPAGTYALRRALRILPGLWVCLAVVAFAFAPTAAGIAHVDYDVTAASLFVLVNASALVAVPSTGLELGAVPFPDTWMGQLWSLHFEVYCYLVVGLVVARSQPLTRLRSVAGALTLFGVGTLVGAPYAWAFAYFGAGWLLATLRDRVSVSGWLVVASCAWVAVVVSTGTALRFAAMPLAFLLLAFGATAPIRWGTTRDLSYGTFIYAFPVQQLLALTGVQRAGPAAFLTASLVASLALAWVSWEVVEGPAQRLARRLRPRGPARASLPDFAVSGARPGVD